MKRFFAIVLSIIMAFSILSVSVASYAAQKPPATSITKISSPSSSSIKVTWKKIGKSNGYQIQYATNSKFKKNSKKITVSKKETVSKKITKLKSSKKYYVRVRTYKKSGDKKIYSSWSKYRSITTKKASSSKSSKSTKSGSKAYVTPTGECYHLDPDCGGKNAYAISMSEAKAGYRPCKKCAS